MSPFKELAMEQPELYINAKREAFEELVMGCVESYLDSLSDDDFEPTMEEFQNDTDIEFDFPDEGRWYELYYANKQAQAEEDRMEYQRDIDMGLV